MELEFKRPQLEDKELIEHYFRTYPSRSCERTFINVFLWARFYGVGYAVIEDTLVFQSKDEKKFTFTYPAGEKEEGD